MNLKAISIQRLAQVFFTLMILTGLAWSIALLLADNVRVVTLDVGTQQVEARVADTAQTRRQGLMGVAALDEHSGMLFIFDQPQPLMFWMKNTLIDLDIAFFDASGRCLNIEQMRAGDEKTRHFSRGPGLYALEMNRDWFARHGISCETLQLMPEQFY